MLKKRLLITILLFPMVSICQNNDSFISQFMHLSQEQLYDTGNYYFNKSIYDTAIVCYTLLTNSTVKDTDYELWEKLIIAQNKIAIIHYNMCDYRRAYELWMRTLFLCETHDHVSYTSKVYPNIGNIYYRFKNYDMAKSYFLKGLDSHQDSTNIVLILNNICASELENEKLDSAFFYLNKSLQISKRHNDVYSYYMLNNLAALYTKYKEYDSAKYYFHLALDEATKNSQLVSIAQNLSDLGKFFFEIKQMDSAIYYLNLSNNVAEKNKVLGILAENYLTLSQIEEFKGKVTDAFEFFKKYSRLKDSVYNIEIIGEFNQLQHIHEISKVNQQIERLALEKKINERTIQYQKLLWYITLSILIFVSCVLLFIFFQKKRLDKAYKVLVEKNLEIMGFQQKNLSENDSEKYKKSSLTYNMQDELLNRILILMENDSIIYDTEFTLDKLAELVQSNPTYVSQTINNALQKNFRSFLNNYRIREAQRLFSEPDAMRYTIETIALRVGFKSRSAFRDVFKEITGVSPNFYIKSIQKQQL
ncbi:MAG: helix-turn-helix domain-containing protein [Lentimicrobiaceae bacterium]|nr:helix-turn-helix domain-containing protein [Lentimicrobiaceae bacterium]